MIRLIVRSSLLSSHLTENVYVTIDIDGFDPAYAPGTGTPEPGDMDWYHGLNFLEKLTAKIIALTQKKK